jgi:hypothetical protein
MLHKTETENYDFETYVLNVATTTLEKGATASKLDTYQFLAPVDAWGFPKYPGKTVILPPEANLVEALKTFIADNETYLREADSWLGTWINPHTGEYYLDITTSRQDLAEAQATARAISLREGRKIVALYNSKLDQTVYLWDDFYG